MFTSYSIYFTTMNKIVCVLKLISIRLSPSRLRDAEGAEAHEHGGFRGGKFRCFEVGQNKGAAELSQKEDADADVTAEEKAGRPTHGRLSFWG